MKLNQIRAPTSSDDICHYFCEIPSRMEWFLKKEKTGTRQVVFVACSWGNAFFYFLKAENDENSKIFVYLGQNKFARFESLEKYKFKVSVIFWKGKTLMQGQILNFFETELNIYLIVSPVPVFENR